MSNRMCEASFLAAGCVSRCAGQLTSPGEWPLSSAASLPRSRSVQQLSSLSPDWSDMNAAAVNTSVFMPCVCLPSVSPWPPPGRDGT